jgi:hypothetical protein
MQLLMSTWLPNSSTSLPGNAPTAWVKSLTCIVAWCAAGAARHMQLDQAPGSSSQSEQQQTPEQLYAAWLSRQYSAYVEALLQLLGSASTSASLQVASLAALMECVRHEAGPAAFSNRLFTRVISLLLTGSGVQPEVRRQAAGWQLAVQLQGCAAVLKSDQDLVGFGGSSAASSTACGQ